MIVAESARRVKRIRGARRAESDVSKLLRSSKSFAARVRRQTELVERAWEEAAEATAVAVAARATETS
jgi:hypothetical protein